jgi:hypothetical protein
MTKIDYDLIRSMELVADDLIEWLDLPMVDYYASHNFLKEERMMRIVGNKDRMLCQISTPIKEFSRWANDYDFEFNLNDKEDRDNCITYIQNNRTDGK